jgi:hypothetical protein
MSRAIGFDCNPMNGTPFTVPNGGTITNIDFSLPRVDGSQGAVTNAQMGYRCLGSPSRSTRSSAIG